MFCVSLHVLCHSEGRPLPEGAWGDGQRCWSGAWPHGFCGNDLQRAELLLCRLHFLLWPANLLPVVWHLLNRKHQNCCSERQRRLFSVLWRHLLCQHCNLCSDPLREFRFTSEVPIWLDYHGKHVIIEQVRVFYQSWTRSLSFRYFWDQIVRAERAFIPSVLLFHREHLQGSWSAWLS